MASLRSWDSRTGALPTNEEEDSAPLLALFASVP